MRLNCRKLSHNCRNRPQARHKFGWLLLRPLTQDIRSPRQTTGSADLQAGISRLSSFLGATRNEATECHGEHRGEHHEKRRKPATTPEPQGGGPHSPPNPRPLAYETESATDRFSPLRARQAILARLLQLDDPSPHRQQARRAQQFGARRSDRSGLGNTVQQSTSSPQTHD